MRIITLLTLIVLTCPVRVDAGDVPAFKHHTFEFSVTPGFDYHFVVWPSRSPGFKQQANDVYRPLAGINLGLAYIYRPVYYVGLSTGFNYLSFNSATKIAFYTTELKGYNYLGFMSVPLLIHAYCPVNKTELELAIGPEFLFPLYANTKFSTTNGMNFNNSNQTYNAAQMKMYSWLAWTVQVSANIPVKDLFVFSVGPEMKFLPVYPLQPGSYYNNLPHQIDYYIGIKLGLRWSFDFNKKAAKTAGKS
jgi:hypothetical protein